MEHLLFKDFANVLVLVELLNDKSVAQFAFNVYKRWSVGTVMVVEYLVPFGFVFVENNSVLVAL